MSTRTKSSNTFPRNRKSASQQHRKVILMNIIVARRVTFTSRFRHKSLLAWIYISVYVRTISNFMEINFAHYIEWIVCRVIYGRIRDFGLSTAIRNRCRLVASLRLSFVAHKFLFMNISTWYSLLCICMLVLPLHPISQKVSLLSVRKRMWKASFYRRSFICRTAYDLHFVYVRITFGPEASINKW